MPILENLGGLLIVPKDLATNVFRPERLTFNPVQAASGDFERVDYWQRYLNTHLAPLAELSGGAVLLMAEDGRIYSCWDNTLSWDGDTFADALENTLIVANRLPRELATIAE